MVIALDKSKDIEKIQRRENQTLARARSDALMSIQFIRSDNIGIQMCNNPNMGVDPDPHARLITMETRINEVAEITSVFGSFQDRSDAARILANSDQLNQLLNDSSKIKSDLKELPAGKRLEKLEELAQGRDKYPVLGKFTQRVTEEKSSQEPSVGFGNR